MRFFAVALIFFGVAASYAQTPEVPHKMHFADMTLTIRDDARREIQKDVDALTKSPKYFGIKVERARTYFPLIEKVFAEERLPDDFKYLVLQESALDCRCRVGFKCSGLLAVQRFYRYGDGYAS